MKIGVISSRSRTGEVFEDVSYVETCLNYVIDGLGKFYDSEIKIISGGGKGPEEFAMDFAKQRDIVWSRIPPRIQALGERAFIERNRSIADASDVLVVFWAGEDLTVPQTLRDTVMFRKPSVIFPI
jgi:hypothetical protein